MSIAPRILPLLAGALLLMPVLASAETPNGVPSSAEPSSAQAPSLPPTQPGRQVVLDASTMVRVSNERTMTLSDFDAETADIVREINRKPGTWQLYLLYTAEDLPERMFHPGFAIRLPGRKLPVPPETAPPTETEAGQDSASADEAPAAPAPR